jgi:hypothetical protein
MNFKFQSHDEYANDKTVKSFDADHLEDILAQFQLFLAGVGFVYEGNLEFVHEETDAEEDWKDDVTGSDAWVNASVNTPDGSDKALDAWKWTVNELKRTGTVMEPSGEGDPKVVLPPV